jgi:hypothetical protein
VFLAVLSIRWEFFGGNHPPALPHAVCPKVEIKLKLRNRPGATTVSSKPGENICTREFGCFLSGLNQHAA